MNATAQSSRPAPWSERGEFGTALAEGFARRIGALAQRLGAGPDAVRWARRAAFAVSGATSVGHVCISLQRLAQRYAEPFDAVVATLQSSGVVSDGTEDAAALRPLVVDAAGRLYLARYYDDERRLAKAVVDHATADSGADLRGGAHEHRAAVLYGAAGPRGVAFARDPSSDADRAARVARLERFFGPSDASQVDWQRAAAALSLTSRLTVVSGGPGTGKTTTVVGMLACLIDANPSLTIALAAPTGKAAQRMQEALLARAASLPAEIADRLPRSAQTLHRLLGLGQGVRARHGRDNPLPYDVLVVDEASMIDVTLAAQLFDALAPDTRLVLLGDRDQLAAVEAGAVFAELSAHPSFSAAGVARIALATGVDEARVRAVLPRPEAMIEGPPADDGALHAVTSDEDAMAVFERLDSSDDAWAWAGLDEPDIAYGGERVRAEPREPGASMPERGSVSLGHESRAPAHDMSGDPHALVDCVVWLERNYRFGLDSAIGRLSVAIRRGDAQAALDALGVSVSAEADLFGVLEDQTLAGHAARPAQVRAPARLDEDGGSALNPRTLDRLAQGFSPYVQALTAALAQPDFDCAPLFDALNTYRILCATRLGSRGVDALNAHMSEHVRRAARVPLAVGTSWFPGRAVMVARNDYALGLFNGDVGIALLTGEGTLRVYFRTADGGMRAVTPAALPPHDTAFALTVHKSQGSEFDHAALILPSSTSRVLTRELVYTAVTRARETVRVVGAREVLADAIAAPTRRDSGLFARIQEIGR